MKLFQATNSIAWPNDTKQFVENLNQTRRNGVRGFYALKILCFYSD